MKKNKSKIIWYILFVIIMIVLIFASTYSLMKYKNIYDSDKEINKKINNIIVKGNELKFNIDNDVTSYCIKPTTSTPSQKSLCWKPTYNQISVKETIIEGKQYYLWIKDNDNDISDIIEIKK